MFSPDAPEEMAECIYRVWMDERFRQELIVRGYRRMEKWNREKFEQRLIKIVEKETGG